MKLSLDLLADCLLDAGAKPLSVPRSSPTFASVELVDLGKTRSAPLDGGTFYLSPSYPSPTVIEENTSAPLAFLVCAPAPAVPTRLPKRWTVFEAGDADFLELSTKVLERTREIEEWVSSMDLAIASGQSLQELLDASEAILGLPVAACGALYDSYTITGHITCEDAVFREIAENGSMSPETVERLREAGVFGDFDGDRRAKVFEPGTGTSCWHMTRHFWENGERVYFVTAWCPEGRPTRTQIALFDLLARHAYELSRKQGAGELTAMGQQEVGLREILWKKELDEGHIREILAKLGHDPDLPHQLAILQPADTGDEHLTYQANLLRERFGDLITCVYENAIVALADIHEDAPERLDRALGALEDYASAHGETMGLSLPLENASEIPAAYEQASFALRIGRKISRERILEREFDIEKRYPEHRFEFRDYLRHELLEREPLGTRGVNPGRKPLLDLAAHDKKHGTEKVRFLHAYLSCNCSTSKTAEAIGMHRNSVLYQVKSIEKILGRRLSDIDLVCHTWMAFAYIEVHGLEP